MSDTADETSEVFVYPGPEVWGNRVVVRVGSWNYLFEKQVGGGLVFLSRDVAVLDDDDEPEPFDPAEYR